MNRYRSSPRPGQICVKGVSARETASEVSLQFAQFGQIIECRRLRPTLYFITFKSSSDAEKAIAGMSQSRYNVSMAKRSSTNVADACHIKDENAVRNGCLVSVRNIPKKMTDAAVQNVLTCFGSLSWVQRSGTEATARFERSIDAAKAVERIQRGQERPFDVTLMEQDESMSAKMRTLKYRRHLTEVTIEGVTGDQGLMSFLPSLEKFGTTRRVNRSNGRIVIQFNDGSAAERAFVFLNGANRDSSKQKHEPAANSGNGSSSRGKEEVKRAEEVKHQTMPQSADAERTLHRPKDDQPPECASILTVYCNGPDGHPNIAHQDAPLCPKCDKFCSGACYTTEWIESHKKLFTASAQSLPGIDSSCAFTSSPPVATPRHSNSAPYRPNADDGSVIQYFDEVVISFVVDSRTVFVRPSNANMEPIRLAAEYGKTATEIRRTPSIGSTVLAEFDGIYRRVLIRHIFEDSKEVLVEYIDYGVRKILTINKLKDLCGTLQKRTFTPQRIFLAGVNANAPNKAGAMELLETLCKKMIGVNLVGAGKPDEYILLCDDGRPSVNDQVANLSDQLNA